MRDKDQMSPTAARLLQSSRHADDPTPNDRARIGKSLRKAMGVGTASAASSAATAAPSLLGKVVFIVASVGVLGTGGAWLSQRSTQHAHQVSAQHASAQPTRAARLEPTALVERAPEDPLSLMQNPEQLLAETKLLQAAQRALHAGKQRRALILLHQHQQRFPRGLLQPERDAARVFSLCEVGNVRNAQEAGRQFAASHPTSPLLAKVKDTCVR